jgi:hypothetical protein
MDKTAAASEPDMTAVGPEPSGNYYAIDVRIYLHV